MTQWIASQMLQHAVIPSLLNEAREGNINPHCNPLFLEPVLTDFFLRAHGRFKMVSNPLTVPLSKGWIYDPIPWMWVGSALTKHMAGALLCQIPGPALKRVAASTFFLRVCWHLEPPVKKKKRPSAWWRDQVKRLETTMRLFIHFFLTQSVHNWMSPSSHTW